MVSLPDFDPNHPGRDRPEACRRPTSRTAIFNKITLGRLRARLGVQDLQHRDGARRRHRDDDQAATTPAHDIQIGRFTIADYHGKHRCAERARDLHVFVEYRLGADGARGRRRAAARFPRRGSACLKPVPIEFDEVAKPHYPEPAWREVNVMTIAYGHGIAVTPAARDHRGRRRSSTAASCTRRPCCKLPPGAAAAGRAGDLGQDLGADAQADAPRRRVRHRQAGRRAGLCRRRQDRHGGKERRTATMSRKSCCRIFVGAFPMQRPEICRS